MFAEFMYLGMTVVTGGNAVIRTRSLDLIVFEKAVCQPGVFIAGLQKTAPAAAAVIVGSIRMHLDEVFLSHTGFDYKPQIFGYGISKTFPNDLTGILNRELYLQLLIPVRIDLQFSFSDPFCIVLIDVFDLKLMFNVEFFQSCQD